MKLEEPTGSGTSANFVNFRDWQPNNEIETPRKSMKRKRESIYPRNVPECNNRKIERQPLPIDTVRSKLKHLLKTTSTAIFIGETGSGKSTQIPQICLELNLKEESEQGNDNGLVTENVRLKLGIIGVTQPRKIAARSLADRVSKEIGCELGELVGYKFRFEDRVGPKTKLAYLTDGILLREALHDQLLSRYSVVIVDEVHERSVHTDILLYILRLAQQARQESGRLPLKVFLMSATMQSERFSEYFNQAPVFYIKGRSHQVELHCANEISINDNDYLYNAITTVLKLHHTEPLESGILVFLTGQDEIDVAGRRINQEMNTGKYEFGVKTFLLYSGASSMQQSSVFLPAPPNHRKIIFATNIAETSITIPGIRIVIDSGKVKEKSFTPHNRVDCLKVVNISKAQAIQRAGRAGRDAPGRCYRLYSKKDYDMMEEMQKPEILRTNLSCVLLDLVEMGLRKLPRLTLIDMPEQQNWDAALEELQTLGAIRTKDNGKLLITEDGKNLVHFPVEPSHAKILVAANKFNCLEEALTVVAFLSSETVFVTSSNDFQSNNSNATSALMQNDNSTHFDAAEGDHVRMIKLYRAFKTQMRNNKNSLNGWCATNGLHCRRLVHIHKIRTQLHELCKDRGLKLGSCGADFTPLRKAVCAGLFMNACIFDMSTNSFRLERKTNTILVKIHPSSCLARRKLSAFVFTDLVMTSDVFARDVTLIDPDWLNDFKKSPKKIIDGRENQIQPTKPRKFGLLKEIMDPSRIQELTYKNPNFPASQLNEENILNPYFCDPENPFYQRQNCDNETLRMQNITNPLAIQEMLTKMNGIQYTLHVASPPLFVIMKLRRTSQQIIAPLCYYYVMEGVVYQCPDLYSLVQSRLISALDSLKNALNLTLDSLKFNVAKGYSWEFKNRPAKLAGETTEEDQEANAADGDLPSSSAASMTTSVRDDDSKKDKNATNPLNVRATAYQRTRTDMLLKALMEQFPPQSMAVSGAALTSDVKMEK